MLKIFTIPDIIKVCIYREKVLAIECMVIRGARQHNLKNIDLELPLRQVIAVTGVSGSGKSSLAFDTIYAEGQRRYIESLSTYARQFIEKLDRPDIDSISGISPTIAIRQKNTVTSARSTVGTATEIYDYLKLLFSRIGRTFCPDCDREVRAYAASEVAREVLKRSSGKKVYILMPDGPLLEKQWEARKSYFTSRGYSRILVRGEVVRIEDFDVKGHEGEDLEILLDRVEVNAENRSRMAEAVELAYSEREGVVEVLEIPHGDRFRFSDAPTCDSCGRVFNKPTPPLFSFNSPFGACPDCKGFGDRMEFSEEMIVPDTSLSLKGKAVDPWARERFEYFYYRMIEFCEKEGIPTDVRWRDLPGQSRHLILEGKGEYIGVIPFLIKMREKSYKKGHRFFTRRYMGYTTCRMCRGSRLRKEAGYVRVEGYSISDLSGMIPSKVLGILEKLQLNPQERMISRDILSELLSRLRFMIDVGLEYLTLDRLTKSLSGGEAQRINLANSLGANLVDTLYVLDEPSVGLHAADNMKLINVMKRLKDLGNTVIVVEHDPEIILSSDYLVDLGPGPGIDGGSVVFSGTISGAAKANIPESKTLAYVFGNSGGISLSKKTRKPSGRILLKGASEHNLKNIDLEIPLGNLVCVTGVSGSGKSTLLVDVLYRLTGNKRRAPGPSGVGGFLVDGRLDRTLLVDQSPIGSTPRSNPITYINGFSYIREVFALQKKSLIRGYSAGRFSFNKAGGRCNRCQGMGYRKVEMHFLADIFVPCEECDGRRYNRETLEVEYKGKDISEVLDMTVDEAIRFFDDIPQLGERMWVLTKVGLGYLKLGQPSNTLSGGEAQRIKIARELVEADGMHNLYIMDEPTTGLHMSDVKRLLNVFEELLKAGHSIAVIEHNMDVIAAADHIIDLGPGGGEKGGRVIACGDPSSIVKSAGSETGKYLKKYLKIYGRRNG